MQYQPVDIIGGFYTDDALPWSAQDTVNWLPVMAEVDGTRTLKKLRMPPGLKPRLSVGEGPIRGSISIRDQLFVVSGNELYRVPNTGDPVLIGTIPGVGLVSMSYNQRGLGNELLVVNGDAGYVHNTATGTFGKITDEGYPGAVVGAYLDSFLLQVEPFGRFWFHSQLADALNYDTTDRYESEASPDKIVTLVVNQFEVVVFNETTTEFFANVGSAINTFQSKRIVIDKGCASRFSAANIDNSTMWLGHDGIVYRLEGYSAVPVSTRAIERAIANEDWSQAFAMVWEDEGHKVYYLTFPSGRTWGYDVVSRLWHRRATYTGNKELDGRWRINTLTFWQGQWIGGDAYSGKLYDLAWDYPYEDSMPLVRERVSGVTHSNQNRVFAPYAELVIETGQPSPEIYAPAGFLPLEESGIPFSFTPEFDATQGTSTNTLTNSVVLLDRGVDAIVSGQSWFIYFETPVRVRITAQSFAAEDGSTIEIDYGDLDGGGTQVNISPTPTTAFEPSPFVVDLPNGAPGAAEIISLAGVVAGMLHTSEFLIEVEALP